MAVVYSMNTLLKINVAAVTVSKHERREVSVSGWTYGVSEPVNSCLVLTVGH